MQNFSINMDEGQKDQERLQIFGFVLAGESRLRRETLVETIDALGHGETGGSLSPNLVVTLDGYVVRWGNIGRV